MSVTISIESITETLNHIVTSYQSDVDSILAQINDDIMIWELRGRLQKRYFRLGDQILGISLLFISESSPAYDECLKAEKTLETHYRSSLEKLNEAFQSFQLKEAA
jgi:hypothetical protein